MGRSCCSVPDDPGSAAQCPRCGTRARGVEWLTVAALTRGRVAPRQTFHVCRTRDCPVVYFGAEGNVLEVEDLNVVPGFKNPDSEAALVCYCFQHTRGEIDRQLREAGDTDVIERITEQIQAHNCACEVRNPTGKCCLGEVTRAVAELQEAATVPQ